MQASKVKFGVEIEAYVPRNAEITTGRYHHGVAINWAPTGWNAQEDGSIRDSGPAGYKPVEVVSPCIAGEDGLVQVYYMVDTLKKLKAQVSPACGLHVHVDARDLTDAQVDAIVASFKQFEQAFYGLSGNAYNVRINNVYCQPSSRWLDGGKANRYQSLNLTNYVFPNGQKKTIEFRMWAGTLDVATIVSAVYMAVALVTKAVNETVTEAPQIDNITKAMGTFVKTHLIDTVNRIVPDETVGDLVAHMMRQARLAQASL